jgi:hypothetical protein
MERHRAEQFGRILAQLPKGASYEKLRSALLDDILARPMEEWLTTYSSSSGELKSRDVLMRSEMDKVIDKVNGYNNPNAVVSLFAWNGRGKEMFEGVSDAVVDKLFDIVVEGNDPDAAIRLYNYGSTWLNRPLSDNEMVRLAKTVAETAVAAAKKGDNRFLKQVQSHVSSNDPGRGSLRTALVVAIAAAGMEDTFEDVKAAVNKQRR